MAFDANMDVSDARQKKAKAIHDVMPSAMHLVDAHDAM